MRAKSIRSIRQLELSRAAFEAVVKFGLRGTTLERVGAIAGVSKGVVLHHFKDKGALLEAVFRRSNSMMSMSLVELFHHTETPYERLWAIAHANFSEPIYNKEVCQAWVSLLSEVTRSKNCQRVQAANNARIKSNLSHELKHFLDPVTAKDFANILGILIDGIWVRAGLFANSPSCERALDEFEFTLMNFVASDKKERECHKLARQKIKMVAEIALRPRFSSENQFNLIN